MESTRKTITQYFDANHDDLTMMADDVIFTVMATGAEHKTPEGVAQMLHYFYHIAFTADATPTNLIIGDGHAVWEGTFHGKHMGEFAGMPATGKEVRVPLCVVYDVEDEQITRGRVYFEMPALFAQLGVA
jgi:steroid delta-isomerase-like uncharacterized protein